jgi:hypothetical protein
MTRVFRQAGSSGGWTALSRSARANGERADFLHRLAFQRQVTEKIGLDLGRDAFIHQLFHGEANLFVGEGFRRGQLADEFFQHHRSLKPRVRSPKSKVPEPPARCAISTARRGDGHGQRREFQ